MKINRDSRPPVAVAVVGAGAAGLMAAIFAASRGNRVLLLERTRDGGRKILISGGGRCNILPSTLAPEQFVSSAPVPLLRRILRTWSLDGQRRFFEQEVCLPLVLESETGKWFPKSNSARQVRDRLVALAASKGVEVWFESQVTGIELGSGSKEWRLRFHDGERVSAKTVIVASGGLSVPATGSDGTGLAWARQLGHRVYTTYPALTPLIQDPARHAALAGVSLEVTLTADLTGQKPFRSRGGFLFTHQGYSGPALLNISHLAVLSQRAGEPLQPISVQWSRLEKPAWNELLSQSPGPVGAVVRRHLPARLVEALLDECKVGRNQSTGQLRREERQQLITKLTSYPLPWNGHEGYKKAEVTGGGVALDELDARTFESRLHPGLFLCGEMLDVFGPIGGYNFAWAWVTGRAAGLGAAEKAGIP
jgi:predicted Rossmann fold flavoprotein